MISECDVIETRFPWSKLKRKRRIDRIFDIEETLNNVLKFKQTSDSLEIPISMLCKSILDERIWALELDQNFFLVPRTRRTWRCYGVEIAAHADLSVGFRKRLPRSYRNASYG